MHHSSNTISNHGYKSAKYASSHLLLRLETSTHNADACVGTLNSSCKVPDFCLGTRKCRLHNVEPF